MYAAYGVMLMAGGAIGFAKAKSRPSLISGSASGVVAFLIAWWSSVDPKPALIVGLILSLFLACFFYYRFAKTRKPMPAMPMMAFSSLIFIGSIVLLILRHG